MIHTYSLIHDDLPAMDDDDLRRGAQPTIRCMERPPPSWLSDGLLTAAFGVLTQAELLKRSGWWRRCPACPGKRDRRAWWADRSWTWPGRGEPLTRGELEQLQQLKTGALISAAAELGCIAAGGTEEQRCAVREYARCIGRAFQIQDDILDVTSTDQELGKSVGSDRVNEKSTFVTVLGLECSRALVEELTGQAEQALSGFAEPDFLLCLARRWRAARAEPERKRTDGPGKEVTDDGSYGLLTGNLTLDLAILAWFAAQVLKTLLHWVTNRNLDLRKMIGSGNMPSSHSAFICAAAASIGQVCGWRDPLFSLSAAIALVVMYDACNVRRAAGSRQR